jgi:hypothetical protein
VETDSSSGTLVILRRLLKQKFDYQPIPVAVLKTAATRLLGLPVANLSGPGDCPLYVLCVLQVEAAATDRSLVQGSPTECVCHCM